MGYYRRFIQNFAELSEPLVALTRKEAVFAWISERQEAFETLKSCLLQAPILGFPTEDTLDTDASLFAVGRRRPESAPGRPGGCHRLFRQPVSLAISTSLLYYASRNVGCYYDVYSLSFVFMGSAVHSAHRSLVVPNRMGAGHW